MIQQNIAPSGWHAEKGVSHPSAPPPAGLPLPGLALLVSAASLLVSLYVLCSFIHTLAQGFWILKNSYY